MGPGRCMVPLWVNWLKHIILLGVNSVQYCMYYVLYRKFGMPKFNIIVIPKFRYTYGMVRYNVLPKNQA